jgi:DNA repair protein RadC
MGCPFDGFLNAHSMGVRRLILALNDPSGAAQPGALAIRSTRGLRALAVPKEMELYHNLIVGTGEVFSMRTTGLLHS